MIAALAFAFGYLLGSIPFGLLLTRAAGGPDIRAIGSGNIGATNVLRTGNKALAAATLLCDMLKGTIAVLAAARYGADPALAAALGAFLGHLFPVWLKFKGGKGVATYIGLLIGLALAGGIVLLRRVARRCCGHPLFLARRSHRERAYAARHLVFRLAQCRGAIFAAHRFVVVHAPREHRAPSEWQRRQNRRESIRHQLNQRLCYRSNGCSAAAINRDGRHVDRATAAK